MLENPKLINREEAFQYLPYSVGIEIECFLNKSKNLQQVEKELKQLNLIHNSYPNDYENTFRIHNGKQGLLDLWEISNYCKRNLLLNEGSGIHYHIDCTDWFDLVNFDVLLDTNSEINKFILSELDTWNYKLDSNKRIIKYGKFSWLNIRNDYKTLEYRVGEMTFDYAVLTKRIVHLCKLTTIVKDFLTGGTVNNLKKLIQDTNNLLNNEKIENLNDDVIKKTLNNRYVKIYL